MQSCSPKWKKKCFQFIVFSFGSLIIIYGLTVKDEDTCQIIIGTGVLVLIGGLLLMLKEFKSNDPVPDRVAVEPLDQPPNYRDSWGKSFTKFMRTWRKQTEEESPPSYRDSWSKGFDWHRRHTVVRQQERNNQICILDSSTLSEDVHCSSSTTCPQPSHSHVLQSRRGPIGSVANCTCERLSIDRLSQNEICHLSDTSRNSENLNMIPHLTRIDDCDISVITPSQLVDIYSNQIQ